MLVFVNLGLPLLKRVTMFLETSILQLKFELMTLQSST